MKTKKEVADVLIHIYTVSAAIAHQQRKIDESGKMFKDAIRTLDIIEELGKILNIDMEAEF